MLGPTFYITIVSPSHILQRREEGPRDYRVGMLPMNNHTLDSQPLPQSLVTGYDINSTQKARWAYKEGPERAKDWGNRVFSQSSYVTWGK